MQAMLNHFECLCVRRMMGIKRGRSELWVDFEQRSLRAARAMIYRHMGMRWGDEFLKAYWSYTGHRIREGLKESASTTGILSMYRGIERWRREQDKAFPQTHERRTQYLGSHWV